MAVIDLRNVTIEIRDGASHKLQVKIGTGNCVYSEKRNIIYVLDRGNLSSTRRGDDVPMDVKMEAEWEYITGATVTDTMTIEDALKQRNAASAWTSTTADVCEPYSVDIYLFDIVTCGALAGETIVLPEFRWEDFGHDLRAAQFSVSGKCNATQATATRGVPVS